MRFGWSAKNTVVLTDGTPGNPQKTIVNEAGLYSLVLGSSKPEKKCLTYGSAYINI